MPIRKVDDFLYEDLSHDIVGAAMAVLNELGPGLDEKIYERALVVELRERGHRISQQSNFEVRYHGVPIGTLIPDLIVDDAVIVDPKVVRAFDESHIAQMIGYLAITGLKLALLVNFKFARLQWKRVAQSSSDSVSAPSA
jgi:GxxExxY protein